MPDPDPSCSLPPLPETASPPALRSSADQEEYDPYIDDYFYDEPGSLPGTLNIEQGAFPSTIVLIDYNAARANRFVLPNPAAAAPYLDTESVSWVDLQGLGSEDVLRQLGEVFALHPLVLEDIVNVPQRPKIEQYDDQLLIVTRMVSPREDSLGFYTEQVSFILGKHYLLTVQEEPEIDTFRPIRDRIRTGGGSIRKQGSDYLAYALIDTIVDGFFPVLEDYGERIEALEDEVLLRPTRSTVERIYAIKRELLALRRAIWPQREAINAIIRDSNDLVSPEVRVYLRDCYDHATQVMDMVETYRELTASLMDVYLSSVSNKMNEVMKVLTVISTVFIPLTFVSGLYGMNFNTDASPFNMPELNWYFGYPACLAVMGTVSTSLVFFFWKRGWFEDFSTIKLRDE